MRKRLLTIIPVILVLGGVAFGAYWWTVLRFVQSTDDAYIQSDTTIISPKVEGYIAEVRIRDNQQVSAGDVLYVIDNRDFTAKRAQAEASVASSQAAIGTFDSRLKLQQSMIDQAAAGLRGSEADASRMQLDYKRYASLMTSENASRQRYEAAQADARKADASTTRSRAGVAAEEAQLAVLQSQRLEEEARLKQAQANLQLAQNDLDNTIIRAPVAGVVGNRAGQIGQYVKPGAQLLSLVPLPRVYVTANFKETQLTRMRPGQSAEVTVDAYPDTKISGRVESFAPASGAQFSILPPDNATGNFTKIVQRVPVRIALPEGGPVSGWLRPGLSVTVSVDTSGSDKGRDDRGGSDGNAGGTLLGAATAPAETTRR